ncbi:SMI1/KNR4 family protein [Tautonia sociabilis]|uniref:SMI1/KNR4 family protein n=1 Tax=Tautonia sociabilis TaxID=2080755 RepID=A0A432MHR7_9BACT|nr:SMI1/KNR4 family protein [Tautonia sociabilis]RUL86476.1 SMI1/KNR4 family protein [Tautonia sociabilis]
MSPIAATADRLDEAIGSWARSAGVPPSWLPSPEALSAIGPASGALRPPADPAALDDWERRHGFRLPCGLRAWLLISDGFYTESGPAVHPIAAIGPMVPFARVPGLLVQPESWFELGNPNEAETICIDLAYRWLPAGDAPIFASGDDLTGLPPRIIAPSFDAWFARLLRQEGRAYWLDPDFVGLGDPWGEHRRRSPAPPLPDRLRRLLPHATRAADSGLDDSSLAASLGISRFDAEALLRHLQHSPAEDSGT